jgi:hypothetical protein
MLAHQLPQLPPFPTFWSELRSLFDWLEGAIEPRVLAPIPIVGATATAWAPPPTIRTWGGNVVEPIRFAAQNRLIVEFDYLDEHGQFSHRRVEPYSLKETSEGHIVLGVFDLHRNATRSFRIDRIHNPGLSKESFEPRYATEIGTAVFSLAVPPGFGSPRKAMSRSPAIRRPRRSPGQPRHIIQCPVCGKRFYRDGHDTRLRDHKAPEGWKCSGGTGVYLGITG